MTDPASRLCRLGASLFERGLVFGRTGNLSVRREDGRILTTPGGSSLGELDPHALALIDPDGRHLDGPRPTKEAFLHAAMYRARPDAQAVVHTHSTYSVAVSCRADVDPSDVLPPLTAYYAMRVGTLPLLPYHAPGDESLHDIALETARHHHALLIANHGPVVAGRDLDAAADALEELEQTARLFFILDGHSVRPLTTDEAAALRAS